MMAIMIPVYIINALYLWPITLWVYIKYGRPGKPGAGGDQVSHCHDGAGGQNMQQKDPESNDHDSDRTETASADQQQHQNSSHPEPKDEEAGHEMRMHEHHHGDSSRPFFATVTAGVCHCGAGCVLGDIVGEWLVYGTNAYIGSNPARLLWAEMLVDFGFAFLFGLVFQYFSIAPMSGDYSVKTVYRALKADALSLISFEVGLFGWMAAFQIGIFNDRIEMNMVTYWWMMQIGMFIGHWTGVPVNWWLIKAGIKEPCC